MTSRCRAPLARRDATPPFSRAALRRDWLLWIAIIAILLFLVVSPFVYLVLTSFQAEKTGDFTLANYATAYGRARYIDALFNSLQLGAGAALLAGALRRAARLGGRAHRHAGRGFPACWCSRPSSRRPTPARWPGSCWPDPTPAGSTASCVVTGAEAGPFNIYSFTGLVVVIALYSFPYIFIFTTAALELVSSEMEDAANILGAGTWRTMRRVTLPLALPAILGGLIICFLEAIALFGSPAMIAIPARFNVVTTQLFQFFGNPVRVEVAAAYAMPLLGVTILLILVQRLMHAPQRLRDADRQGRRAAPIRLGRWRWAMFGYAMLVAALAVFLPLSSWCKPRSPRPGARLLAGQHHAAELPFRAVRASRQPSR